MYFYACNVPSKNELNVFPAKKAQDVCRKEVNWPGDLKHLGSAGRQADEYIAPGGKFFMFFMYLILPIGTRLSYLKLP